MRRSGWKGSTAGSIDRFQVVFDRITLDRTREGVMLTSMLLVAVALADDTPFAVGGGVDAALIGTEAGTTGGFRQIEGDVAGEGGPVTGRADLDLGVTLDGHGVQAVTLVPQRAWLRAGGKDVWFGGGI